VADEKAIEWDYVNLDDANIYKRDMGWLVNSDLVVAEVTIPSLGVGYEIGYAVSLGKPVICLFKKQSGKRLSAMINGNKKVKTIVWESLEDVKTRVTEYISNLENVD
jgi:nucleoside 2-deoxyribosyltransferase